MGWQLAGWLVTQGLSYWSRLLARRLVGYVVGSNPLMSQQQFDGIQITKPARLAGKWSHVGLAGLHSSSNTYWLSEL